MSIRITEFIRNLPETTPFVGPEAIERLTGLRFAARMGANENVFGPSPKAISAMQDEALECWKYCDPESHDLRTALATKLDVEPANIIVGPGIDGLLGKATRILVEPGVTTVMADGAYPTFALHVSQLGGKMEKVPYVNDCESIDGLLEAARRTKAAILYFTNPDNPMGTFWEREEIARLLEVVPTGTALFLDEAYCEFSGNENLAPLDVSNPQVIRFRTFSKAYGMAGARIGYAIGHADVIATMSKVRDQYGVSRISQAGALAALGDDEWLTKVRQWTAEGRTRIRAIANANGLETIESHANFVAVDMGGDSSRAKRTIEELAKRGIFMRMPFAAPGNRCIRVGVGRPQDLDLFEQVLPEALAVISA